MELGIGGEQIVPASGANVHTIIFCINEIAGKWPLSPGFAQDVILPIGELFPPLMVCFGNFFHSYNHTRGVNLTYIVLFMHIITPVGKSGTYLKEE